MRDRVNDLIETSCKRERERVTDTAADKFRRKT